MTDRVATPPRANTVLVMLLIVYIFNFIDRQILAILAAPIQAELGLDDSQMGLLGGVAFALLYSTLAVPLALLADRTSRSWVITIALVAWSGFTALCGAAQGFWHIFLARLGVGVGEAGGVAPSYALIADYFPSSRRGFALGVYSLGVPVGSAAGVLLGGYIAATVDWRWAFVAVGLCGLILAPVFKLIVKDRAAPDLAAGQAAHRPRLSATAGILARKPSFWFLALGAASSSAFGYGALFWLPSLLQRSFGLDLVASSRFFGALLLIGGVAGVVLGGVIGDRLGRRGRGWYAWVPAIAFVVAIPFYAGGVMSSSTALAFVLLLVPNALVLTWLGPVLSAVQHLVTPPARATASALFLMINNLIGLGGGVYGLGALSESLKPTYGTEALRYSTLYALLLYVLAATLLFLAGRYLPRDWIGEGGQDD